MKMFLLILAVFPILSCTGELVTEEIYKLNDDGPGGGVVFYDKGKYSDGWRYKEVTKKNLFEADGSAVRYTWEDAVIKCSSYENNDRKDWYMPSVDDFNYIKSNLPNNAADISLNSVNYEYWTSTIDPYDDTFKTTYNVNPSSSYPILQYRAVYNTYMVRGVRNF